jgi:hypothetical protein
MADDTNDSYVAQIESALVPYQQHHPAARIKVRRYNSVSIRIRVIDPAFRGRGLAEREDELWPLIESLPADAQEEITMLLLLAPEEATNSLLNAEFEDPSRSLIV